MVVFGVWFVFCVVLVVWLCWWGVSSVLPRYVFWEIRMPVMVPVKPVIAAKISLFHVPSNAKCAISNAVKLPASAMANFTPRNRLSLCDVASASAATVLSVVLRA